MFTTNGKAYLVVHPVTRVQWVVWGSVWDALATFAFVHGITLTEAVLMYERQ